jgi:predicted GNAT family N-acyltransferase
VSGGFRVRLADWAQDEPALRHIRRTVFIVEQSVPEELEWDGIDADCCHAIAEDDTGQAIGCARLLPDGHIGRVAVVAAWRGRGVGDALLERMLALARELGHDRVVVNAQTQVLAFYERRGFIAFGPEFEEAGIAHRAMRREL